MSGVYGIRLEELARLCDRAPVFNNVKVIDPVTLIPWNKMESCGLEVLAAFARAQRKSLQ